MKKPLRRLTAEGLFSSEMGTVRAGLFFGVSRFGTGGLCA